MKIQKMLPISLLAAVLTTFAASAFGQEVVPITATLPIKAVGDSCIELSLGTVTQANLIAAEGVAITADRTSLLTCQSGVWAKQAGGGGALCNTQGTFLNLQGGGGGSSYRFTRCEAAALAPGVYCHGYKENDALFSGFIDNTSTKMRGLVRDNGDSGTYFDWDLGTWSWVSC